MPHIFLLTACLAPETGIDHTVISGTVVVPGTGEAPDSGDTGGPTEPEGVLIGAYAKSDPLVAENPLGGTTVTDWKYRPDDDTWLGNWRMLFIRTVVTTDEDTGDDVPAVTVATEGAEKVYIRGGTMATLNSAPIAGDLYSTASLGLTFEGDEITVEQPVVLDGVAPRVIGYEWQEDAEDTSVVAYDGIDLDLVNTVAQDLGDVSPVGFLDILEGSLAFDLGDGDVYSFTVPADASVALSAAFDDPGGTDLDFYVYGPDGADMTVGDCLTENNPEVCNEGPFAAGETYYFEVVGYAGSGDIGYTVDFAWIAP